MYESAWSLSRQSGFRIDFLESKDLESGNQLKESATPLTFGIRNPSSTDKESVIQYLGFGIHRVNSRIQDSLGLP